MAKQLAVRMYHGFSITMLVDLAVHFVVAQLNGSVVTQGFAARFGCESSAVLAQLALVAVIGMVFAASASIFEIERWSFLKQGVVHFLVTAAVWMPIAWLCWSPVRGFGLILTILGWTLTYAITWGVQYVVFKRKIAELNRCIHTFHKGERNT